MAAHNLPLLHKYVFNHDDDLKLKMSKLQYRLCVQEVSHVILGKHMAVGDFEPSIVPDYDMATSVEAHPPKMDDYLNTDEGLSSPESEDYPHKQQHDYPYNDSGILSDESTLNNRTQSDDANEDYDDYDDNLSDVSDPNDYHINTQDLKSCNDTELSVDPDDSAVVMNGSAALSDNELEIIEDTIEPEESTRQKADISFESFPEPTESELAALKISDTLNTGESDDNMCTESPRAITPVITVTDTEMRTHQEPSEDEIEEEVIMRSEVKREESDDDLNRVDFVSGQACNDVDTALQILKTRYRLSTSTLKKCVITFSKWNLQDIVRAPNEDTPWWNPKEEEKEEEKENVTTLTDTINRRDGEIADLLKKILEEDQRKREEEERRRAPPEPEIVELKEPHLEAIPENDAENQDAPTKKKKGNIFQRMMRALRKRLSGNRHRA